MNEYYKKSKIKKAIRITLLVLTGLTLCLGIFFYGIIHNYINKMNFTNSKEVIAKELANDSSLISELYPSEGSEGYLVDADGTVIDSMQTQVETSEENNNTTQGSSQDDIESLEAQIIKNLDSDMEIKRNKKILNILLIGSDTINSGERGRSDCMILVTINKDTKKIVATSFLRDIYLQIPGENNNRLNASYAYGGADLLMETMKDNFKIQIDRYVLVDFSAFIEIIDVIGGITLEVEEAELDIINEIMQVNSEDTKENINTDNLTKLGTCQLNGDQALSYARNRSSVNGDFDRTNRQRKVLAAIYEKVKNLNFLELNKLFNTILPQVTTNFTESGIFKQLLSIPAYTNYNMEQWSVPMEGTYTNMRIRNMAVLGIDFEENIEEIQHRLYEMK